jgi:hypothetical protein
MDIPRSSISIDFFLDIEAGKAQTVSISSKVPSLRTVENLGTSWREDVKKAQALYPKCHPQMVFYSPSDPGFQQFVDWGKKTNAGLSYTTISGTLSYRNEGRPGVEQQSVPLVAVLEVDSGCPRKP